MKNKTKKYFLNLVSQDLSGEEFFDRLDEEIKRPENFWMISESLRKIPKERTLILSGGFGKRVAHLMKTGKIASRPYVLFEGGLRKTNNVILIEESKGLTKEATFFDDSIYGGGTYKAIKEWMRETGFIPSPDRVFCIYDGCPEQRGYESLFRYYEFFPDKKPNFKF